MIKVVLLIAASFVLGGCSLTPQKSGIEIMSNPPAKVYLDGKEAGMSPYKNTSLKPGGVVVKLVNSKGQWERKVELKNNVNTVIKWEFGDNEKESGGYVLSMEKTGDSKRAGLLVNSQPDKTAVSIDNEIKGYAPTKLEDIGEGDRQLSLSFPGYKNINVFLKAIKGYELTIDANLAKEPVKQEEGATTTEITPMPAVNSRMALILETETGWLRVRESASSGSAEVARVNPGGKYKVLEENGDWVKIEISSNKSGWVSAKYVEIQR